MSDRSPEHDIAIVGMSGRFPGAPDLKGFWRNLEAGVEAVEILSDEALLAAGVPRATFERPDYVKAVSALDDVDAFDADFFGYNARDAAIMDPQQRLFLQHAWAALEDAGTTPTAFEGLIGVYAGVAWNTYLLSNLMAHRELFDGAGGFQVFITNDKDFMATRVAYKLDLGGPAVVVQSSCSTSLVATHLACLALQSWECDLALVGGVTVRVPQRAGYFYQEGGLASPDGHCRTFDAQAAGTIFGSGIGVVALKRLADARADGDAIRAVIKGSAINNDGSTKVSYTAPSVEGQAEVIAAAQEMAGVEAESIRYVECHGTATALGDPIEVRALTKVFGAATDEQGFCALGSVKSNVGHLDAAAGVAGLIKTVLALEHQAIPPTLHFERPNPAIDFDTSPFYVAAEREAWGTENGTPRRAGVSSFGVGGTNAHVVLEEAPPAAPSGPSRPWQLLALSAKSEDALEAMTQNLHAHLSDASSLDDSEDGAAALADIAWTLRQGRAVFRHRRVAVIRGRGEAMGALAGELPGQIWTAHDSAEPRSRPIAFLFSGQGSHYLGMGHGLYRDEAIFRDTVDRCAAQLAPLLGGDLRDILWPGEAERDAAAAALARTAWAQPALFVVSYALAQLWQSWGVVPQAMLGHSIGEWVAACLGGTLSLDDALTLVAKRGQLMDALPAGAMLAVPLSPSELEAVLAADPRLALAAINAPSRTVISGPEEAIEACSARLGEGGTSGRRLHTSHAFHSSMMEPILAAFTAEMTKVTLSPPEIPWVSNVSGTWITAEEATDPAYWARHLRQPVRFADGVATLLEEDERVLLEVGPGRALATLAGRHTARQPAQPVLTSLRHPQDAAEGPGEDQAHMLASLGRLWLAGVELDPTVLYAAEQRRRVPLPTYPFAAQRFWIDAGEAASPTTAAPSPASSALHQRPEVADWFYLPAWKPSLLQPATDAAPPASWLVLEHPGSSLASDLVALSARVTRVVPGAPGSGLVAQGEESFAVDPADRSAWTALGTALTSGGALPDAVLHAWSLDDPAAEGIAAGLEVIQRQSVAALLALARMVVAHGISTGIDVVIAADGIARLVAGETLRPEKAMLLGFGRVLPEEIPGVRCKVVDVGVASSTGTRQGLAARLVAEVVSGGTEETIAHRGRERFVEAFEPVRVAAPDAVASGLRHHGVYVLTGGLDGNGYALARYLAREWQARLVLLGEETPIADRHGRRVAALEELGGTVMHIPVDITDAIAVGRALDTAKASFGGLHGVLHTATTVGEPTFRSLLDIDDAHLDAHLRPKIHGALALDVALRAREDLALDFCLLLSSLASVLGGLAYGAYAAANHVLDALARAGSTIAWTSIGWDVWEFEDEAEQITALRPDLAELAMTPRQGEEAFQRLLGLDVDHMLVSTGNLAARLAARHQRITTRGSAPAVAAGKRHPRPALQTPWAAPENELEARIAKVWEDFLGFEKIGVNDNFFDLGGDSFIAVRVAAALREALDVELPVAQLYQRLTIRALAALLAEDETAARTARAAHLATRRESMDRRRQLLARRRTRTKV